VKKMLNWNLLSVNMLKWTLFVPYHLDTASWAFSSYGWSSQSKRRHTRVSQGKCHIIVPITNLIFNWKVHKILDLCFSSLSNLDSPGYQNFKLNWYFVTFPWITCTEIHTYWYCGTVLQEPLKHLEGRCLEIRWSSDPTFLAATSENEGWVNY
jgi:hypothetical protein